MKPTLLTTLSACVLLSALSVHAQAPVESPVHWTAQAPGQPLQPGERFEIKLEAKIDGNWHLYSTTQPAGGPNPTKFSLLPGSPFSISGSVRQSPPTSEFDQNFGIETEFFSTGADFWIPLQADSSAIAGSYKIVVQAVYQVCNDTLCLPPRPVAIPSTVALLGSDAGSPAEPDPGTARPDPVPSSAQPSLAPGGASAELEQALATGFLPFLWLAMSMGALSLATPCVFPMIPITVSYFTKSAESRPGSGVRQALIYSAGIVFTFTGLGLGLAAFLGASGINRFAANPWVNLLITAVFVLFALNLFGLFQVGAPSALLSRLSKAADREGYFQTLLMALTFTLTSFTCTVPFVGTVLVATAQGHWFGPVVGMLAYSIVFAAPFFILALVPGMVTALPKSGGWLNSVKVTMGFLEIAAAMKFISNVDLVWNWHIFTREMVLAVWLAIAVLAAIYLLGKIRLPHDIPVESLGVLRMMFALAFLATAFLLLTGLLGASLGELEAFLPPRTSGQITLTPGHQGQELSWNTNLQVAFEQSSVQQKPIFVDFTGYTCTNCRWMEANIFPNPAVHAELQRFVRVQLYTDGAGEEFKKNQEYQREQFGTVALPLYVILDSQGRKLAVFPGMTRRPEEFVKFLRSFGTQPSTVSNQQKQNEPNADS